LTLGAIFVLFNPTPQQLSALRASVALFDDVAAVVVDNSPAPSADAREAFGVNYAFHGNRGGIAGAFNRGVQVLLERGCDFFFTFDQDSTIDSSFFTQFRAFITQHDASLVCPDFVDIHSNTSARFTLLNRFSFHLLQSSDPRVQQGQVTSAISSGFGFSREIFERVGGFREDYVIDHVDTAFCYGAWCLGEGIRVNPRVVLRHAIGQREHRRLLGIDVVPCHHPSVRRYYMARNGVDVARRMYRQYPSALALEIARVGHELVSVVLFEREKLRKLRALVRGWHHGLIGKMGPAPDGI
jgi:rhamnosyltransferase